MILCLLSAGSRGPTDARSRMGSLNHFLLLAAPTCFFMTLIMTVDPLILHIVSLLPWKVATERQKGPLHIC